jgi:hypothetical protein
MSYIKLNSIDGIGFIPLREPEKADIENNEDIENNKDIIKAEKIDIEAQNQNISNSTTTCVICLENNDKKSVKLNCRCKQFVHADCYKEMKKNKIIKCPICYDIVIRDQESNISINNIRIIFVNVIITFVVFTILFISTELLLTSLKFIFLPSEHNYCDNIYRKCEYFKVSGILVNNTIDIKVNNFVPIYNLISTYKYDNNKTCITDYHTYSSYEDIQNVKELTINTNKDIFISYSNNSKCKDNYKYYNPELLYVYIYDFICLLCLSILPLSNYIQMYLKNNNYNIIIIFLHDIIHSLLTITIISTLFNFSYYRLVTLYYD